MYRSSPPALSCPECAVGLSFVQGDVPLHTCAQCGGAWFDAEASMSVLLGKSDPSGVQRASRPPAPKPHAEGVPETPRPCARCGETMLPYPFGEVMLDTCPAHGTWFDHDEIARVVKAARKMHDRAQPGLVELPKASDVWATARFGLGAFTLPFRLVAGVLASIVAGALESDSTENPTSYDD